MEENRFYVYRHIRLDKNEPFYVGIGTKVGKYITFNREYSRAFSKANRNRYWKFIVEKHGYKVDILFECDNRELIQEKEREFILLYGRQDLGTGTLVNMTDGGDGIEGVSDEVKLKMSESASKRFSSEEERLKQSERTKNTWKNDDFVAFKSKQAKDMWKDPETRTKLVQASKDKWKNSEYRERMSKIRKEVFNTLEHKEKLKKTARELNGVIVVDKETGIFYSSLAEACEVTNLNYKLQKSRFRRQTKLSRFIRVDDKEINDNQIKSI